MYMYVRLLEIRSCRFWHGLGGGEGGIRTPETLQASMGEIRPELGALFGPKKSIRAGENLFAWDSAPFGLSPVPASGSSRSMSQNGCPDVGRGYY